MTNRNFIGVDINPNALEITKNKVNFECEFNPIIDIVKGDARNLSPIADDSIDLICTHPPYANIIHYSEDIVDDMSLMSMKDFLLEIGKVADECYRVLKKTSFALSLWAICATKEWYNRLLLKLCVFLKWQVSKPKKL